MQTLSPARKQAILEKLAGLPRYLSNIVKGREALAQELAPLARVAPADAGLPLATKVLRDAEPGSYLDARLRKVDPFHRVEPDGSDNFLRRHPRVEDAEEGAHTAAQFARIRSRLGEDAYANARAREQSWRTELRRPAKKELTLKERFLRLTPEQRKFTTNFVTDRQHAWKRTLWEQKFRDRIQGLSPLERQMAWTGYVLSGR